MQSPALSNNSSLERDLSRIIDEQRILDISHELAISRCRIDELTDVIVKKDRYTNELRYEISILKERENDLASAKTRVEELVSTIKEKDRYTNELRNEIKAILGRENHLRVQMSNPCTIQQVSSFISEICRQYESENEVHRVTTASASASASASANVTLVREREELRARVKDSTRFEKRQRWLEDELAIKKDDIERLY